MQNCKEEIEENIEEIIESANKANNKMEKRTDKTEKEEKLKNQKKNKKIKCPYCKNLLPVKNRFCTSCGNQLNKGIYEKTSNIGTKIEKIDRLKLEDQYYSHLRPRMLLPHHLTEPIYTIGYFPPGLKPEEYHAGNSVLNSIPEKTAFFMGTTPDRLLNHAAMRQTPPHLEMEHYQDYGKQMYNLIKDSHSLVMTRVKKKKF